MATTTLAGVGHYAFFRNEDAAAFSWADLPWGLVYSAALLAILLSHEMGHYLTCRWHGIAATLPYLIPFPFLFGTMGAVIRIKSPFMNRKQLFDVGIAGPIAGFAVLTPLLALALNLSEEAGVRSGPPGSYIVMSTPFLFDLLEPFFYSGGGGTINLHPIGFAAWFGILATGLNLLPMGQLDGGHVVYALLGEKAHRIISHLTFFSLIALSFFSWPFPAYLLFAILVRIFGFRHPPPLTSGPRLKRGRIALGILGLLILAVTFVPVPFRPL